MRLHKWRRPRRRIHPPQSKLGIRATKTDEVWHVDTSVSRLGDDTRTYRYAVIARATRLVRTAYRLKELQAKGTGKQPQCVFPRTKTGWNDFCSSALCRRPLSAFSTLKGKSTVV